MWMMTESDDDEQNSDEQRPSIQGTQANPHREVAILMASRDLKNERLSAQMAEWGPGGDALLAETLPSFSTGRCPEAVGETCPTRAIGSGAVAAALGVHQRWTYLPTDMDGQYLGG